MTGVSRASLVATLLTSLLLVLTQSTYAAWAITDFEIVVGFPDWNIVHLEPESLSGKDDEQAPPDNRELNENADWELHNPGPQSLTLMYKFLLKIAEQYSKFGFPEPTHLQKSSDGKRYRVYLYDFDVSAYDRWALLDDTELIGGRTNTNCEPEKDGEKPSWIAYNTARIFPNESENIDYYPEMLLDTLSHELFHAVQKAALHQQERGYCGAGSTIWTEGTATAVGVYMANAVYPKYLGRGGRVGDSKKGLFNFKRPWTNAERALGADDRSSDVYTINALFRYAMERYRGPAKPTPDFTGLAVAKRYLEELEHLGNLDSWLNERLRSANPDMPLPSYFPEFLAHHADSAARYGREEQKWVDGLFDTCESISLPMEAAWKSPGKMTLKDNAARCFDVTVKGLKEEQCLYVNLMVERQSYMGELGVQGVAANELDQLQLSMPKMGGVVVEEGRKAVSYDCYEPSRSGKKPQCTDKLLTAELPGETGSFLYSRSWFVREQRATGKTLENRYILSSVRNAYSGSEGEQPVYLTIAPSHARLNNNKAVEYCASSAINSHQGVTHPHPVKGPLPGAENTAQALLPFLAGLPNIAALDSESHGISRVVLREFSDDSTEKELAGKFQFEFRTEEPIPFGASGRYPAAVSGTRLGPDVAMVWSPGNEPSATIDVVRFDHELLHVKVSGRYCLITAENPECVGNYPVSGEVVKAFGWTYDRAQTPTAIFTPGMRPHARLFKDTLPGTTGANQNNVSVGSSTSAGPPAGSGAAGAGDPYPCDCTCEGYARLHKEFDSLNEAAGGDEGLAALDLPAGALACAGRCMAQYYGCETD